MQPISAIILIAALICLEQSKVPDPVYHGKRLSVWLRTYDRSSTGGGRPSKQWDEADEAVRHIGTNAIPLLLDWLCQSDASLRIKATALLRKQRFARIWFVPSATRSFEASMAFVVLADRAKDAVPDLIKTYEENHSKESQGAIEHILGWIGPGAYPAVPLLMQAATNSDREIRANAMWALGEIHSDPQSCIPMLIQALGYPDDDTRANAAHALGMFGTNAQSAIPFLTALTNAPLVFSGYLPDSAMELRIYLREALAKIGPLVESNVFDFDLTDPGKVIAEKLPEIQ